MSDRERSPKLEGPAGARKDLLGPGEMSEPLYHPATADGFSLLKGDLAELDAGIEQRLNLLGEKRLQSEKLESKIFSTPNPDNAADEDGGVDPNDYNKLTDLDEEIAQLEQELKILEQYRQSIIDDQKIYTEVLLKMNPDSYGKN